MTKKILILSVISVIFLAQTTIVSADEIRPDQVCVSSRGDLCCSTNNPNLCNPDGSFSCQFVGTDSVGQDVFKCKESPVGKSFGQIKPPTPLQGFIKNNTTSGAGAISQFLSNLILLIYSLAGVVLIFMLIWGAFEWLTSGGDKEKIAAARNRIIHALIGIGLFAVAFAIIRILGIFTGFTFFTG